MLRAEETRAPRSRAGRPASASSPTVATLPAEAAVRFEALRAWRAAIARDAERAGLRHLPRCDAAADRAAEPGDLDALAGVDGVGATKLERYGRDVLDTLANS